MRLSLLILALATATAIAAPAKKPPPKAKAKADADPMITWRKQEGDAFNQFQDAVAQVKKQLDAQPANAGPAAAQLGTFVDTMSLQLNMALRTGHLRATDTMPTKQGNLTGPQMLKELARIRREVSDFAVKYGDKAARLERLTGLEKSYDWQQRQPSSMAAFEAAGRMRYAYAVATSRISEAMRFAKLAAETKQLGGVTDKTPLKYNKTTVTLATAVADVKKLGQQAQKDQPRLKKLAAAEQQRAEAARRKPAAAAARTAANPAPAAAAAPPVWHEDSVAAPLQTDEGDPPVEASPEEPAAEAPAAAEPAAAAEPPAPACNPHGATCGNTNPPDNPCCAGTSCTSQFQYSDGTLGIGYCQ